MLELQVRAGTPWRARYLQEGSDSSGMSGGLRTRCLGCHTLPKWRGSVANKAAANRNASLCWAVCFRGELSTAAHNESVRAHTCCAAPAHPAGLQTTSRQSGRHLQQTNSSSGSVVVSYTRHHHSGCAGPQLRARRPSRLQKMSSLLARQNA